MSRDFLLDGLIKLRRLDIGDCGMRLAIASLCLFVSMTGHVAADTSNKSARIGMLCPSKCVGAGYVVFDEELRKLGWIEGRNLTIERREAEGRYERLPGLAAEIVGLRPDVIVGPSSTVARAVKDATSEIPIVFSFIADPVGAGLVQTLARPGTNVTGVTGIITGEYIVKNFQILHELVPSARKFGVLTNALNETAKRRVAIEVPVASQQLDLKVEVVEVQAPGDIPGAVAKLRELKVDALVVVSETILSTPADRLPDLIAQAGIPAIYQSPEAVRAGGLIAYSWDTLGVSRRHAQYVDKILRGANPAETPVEQPTRYNLLINMKTAKTLGLVVPNSLLVAADELIE
ncbi:ABC transporter substrate-binding protein [Prosthecomicrobium sp. N25]|uniref:ABC transporter substrate-binding protein n=1 Tax=Prosthecomicrobium sp. N25 TaxID=3129254 RepID=UPI0030775156